MERNSPINDFLGTTMNKIREMIDANTIIGEPIHAEGVTLVPVSRLSFGFASGGMDYTGKNQKADSDPSFGGGGGAGVNIIPVAFLVIKEDSVKMLPVGSPALTTVDRAIELVPELVDRVTDFLEKQQEKRDKDSF